MRSQRLRNLLACTFVVTTTTVIFVVYSEKPTALISAQDYSETPVLVGNSLLATDSVFPQTSNVEQSNTDPMVSSSVNLIGDFETPLEAETQESALVSFRVDEGDSLSALFFRAGFTDVELHEIQQASPTEWPKSRIYPGQAIHFRTGKNDELSYLRFDKDALTQIEFTLEEDGYVVSVDKKTVVEKETYNYITIERGQSVISAGLAGGIKQEKTAWQIPKLLQWDIDFHHDIHPGDSYQILYYEQFLDGEYYDDGEILALIFNDGDTTHEIIRFAATDNQHSYYTADGNSSRGKFLRAPLEYTRVSSEFNPQRLHPVHKVVLPHNGIDYAAPTGTPVYSTGDGVVEIAGRKKANGNYVVIEHGPRYTTKYLHLHRIDPAIRPGVKVKQGQRIGSVGQTGTATGPHLHYEFLVDGTHKNPRIVDLPRAEKLTEEQLRHFKLHSVPIFTRMESLRISFLDMKSTIVNR